jgi:hypothetical protein
MNIAAQDGLKSQLCPHQHRASEACWLALVTHHNLAHADTIWTDDCSTHGQPAFSTTFLHMLAEYVLGLRWVCAALTIRPDLTWLVPGYVMVKSMLGAGRGSTV